MIDDPDLWDLVFGIGQVFCVILLLLGGYLSTLDAVFTDRDSAASAQKPESSQFNIARPIRRC